MRNGNARELVATIEQASQKSSQRIDPVTPGRFGFAENRCANRVHTRGRVFGGRRCFTDRDDA